MNTQKFLLVLLLLSTSPISLFCMDESTESAEVLPKKSSKKNKKSTHKKAKKTKKPTDRTSTESSERVAPRPKTKKGSSASAKKVKKDVHDKKMVTPKKTPSAAKKKDATSDEESVTPSSEQRSIIFKNRTAIEKAGSLPASLEKKFITSYSLPHVVFSPEILPVLLNLIAHEKKGIHGACYEFDDQALCKAWCNAQKENPQLASSLVVNRSSLAGPKKTAMRKVVKTLLQAKIAIYKNKQRYLAGKYDKTRGMSESTTNPKRNTSTSKNPQLEFFENMHHKFFIFSKNSEHGRLVVTGSFNWTESANDRNWENIVILNDKESVSKFIAQWKELREYREKVTLSECE